MAGCLTAAPNWQQIIANDNNSWLYIYITLTSKFLSILMNKWLNKSNLKIFGENRVSYLIPYDLCANLINLGLKYFLKLHSCVFNAFYGTPYWVHILIFFISTLTREYFNIFFLNWFLLNSLWLLHKFDQFGTDIFFLIVFLCF